MDTVRLRQEYFNFELPSDIGPTVKRRSNIEICINICINFS